jgi:hypothetical protein
MLVPGVDEALTAADIAENGPQWYHAAAALPVITMPMVRGMLRPLRGPAGRQARGGFAKAGKPKSGKAASNQYEEISKRQDLLNKGKKSGNHGGVVIDYKKASKQKDKHALGELGGKDALENARREYED